ncbi:MAG TPA: hypothetical protein VLY63_11550, partial [Anaerolineae bacterium]|nr:hypothetical protein [Anaerolineae bacterium]
RAGFTVWVDYDDDELLDAGEPSAVTGSNGSYALSDVRLGNWKVREQAPAGQAWSCSYPNAGTEPVPVESTQCYHQIQFQSGVSPNGIAFGNWAAATVTGVKLEDKDADGIIGEGGEKPIEGWVIHAFADDGDRILSADEFAADAVVSDTTSVSSGTYSLTVPPGDYIICEGAQSGWAQSYPSYPSAANSADCSAGATMLNASGWAVSLQSASSEADRDFGNWTNATVTGVKLEDKDADGSIGEDSANGLDGWVIRAYSDGDGDGVLSAAEFALGPIASSTTASGGAYSLSLIPGDYIVCEVAQAGWTQSYPDAGNTACSGGVPALNSGGWAVTVQSSGRDPVGDFGNWTNAAVVGTKLEDKDADGDISTGNESPLAGWVVHAYADDDGDGALSADEFAAGPIASNTTDIQGDYGLTLPPDDYILCEEAQPGWAQSYPSYPGDAGSADCSAGDPALHGGGWAVTLESSDSEPNKHFGNYSECDIQQVTDTAGNVTNSQPSMGGYGDGVRIAFVSDGNLDPVVGNIDGSSEVFWVAPETLPITFRQITPVSDGMTNEQPVISGDGEQIAFASDAPMAGNVDRNQEIFRYGIEHGRIVGVTDSTASVFPGFNLSPSIDESGTRIVFASDHNLTGQNPDANLEIYLYDQAYVFDHVSADGYHTCGVRIDGQVECWGRPYEGQSSPPTGSWAEVSAGFYHTCGVRIDGQVECWGDNYEGQSSPPAGPFSQISAGGYHTCGLRPDGLVECWGRNYEGQSSAPGDTFTQVTAG